MTRIRRATCADAPAISELLSELGYPTSERRVARRLEVLSTDSGHEVLVAVGSGGSLDGWVHVFAALRLGSDAFGEIGGLVVVSARRRQGVGRALVAAAEGWCRELGLAALRVRSNVVRRQAAAFYESLGYATSKQQTVFVRHLEDC